MSQSKHTAGRVLSRTLLEEELDALSRITRIVPKLPLLTGLVEKHLSLHDTVMLHRDCRFTRGTHFRVYSEVDKDWPGWKRFYVRTGKRGTCKRYLASCDITFINGEPTLFEYRTED